MTDIESFTVSANGLQIAVEAFGSPADPTLLLVMGLGTQMIGWPDELCRDLAGRGYRVVRFDNRDIGLSTHLDGQPAPDLVQVMLRRRKPAYGIPDMARDTIGVIGALGSARVHLAGASMGGFIAQTVALQRPDLLRSLTLIMTSTGSRRVGRPGASVARTMLRPRPPAAGAGKRPSRPAWPPSPSSARRVSRRTKPYRRQLAGLGYDRGYDVQGQRRQLAAIAAQPDRTAALRKLRLPTLVQHGLEDPLVALSGGLALARSIPEARFIGYAGMGHDFPRPLWPTFAADIGAHLQRVDASAAEAAADGAQR